jgi:hypothetical protein
VWNCATENGKTIKYTSGVIYNAEYVRRGGRWLISKRVRRLPDDCGGALAAALSVASAVRRHITAPSRATEYRAGPPYL